MNRFSARLAAAMLLVAFLALLVMGSALIAAFQDAERRVAPLPPPAAVDRPFPPGGRRPAPPSDLSPRELTRYQARVGRAVFQDIASSAGRGALVGAGVAVLAAALLSALLAGGLARPLRGVSEAARQVARGDLGARAPPPGRGDPQESRALVLDFNRMAVSLQSADRQRRALFADVAHELRTPISAMRARLEALQDGLMALDASQLGRLHAQATHLERLVEDVRTLSLADAGTLTLRPREVDPAALLAEVTAAYTPLAGARRQTLTLHVSAPLPPLSADPQRLTQLLGNLLDNAIKAAPEGGWVRLDAAWSEGTLRLTVSDSGSGLSDEALRHAFDRFYRQDTGGGAAGGSGLGLAIVRTLAELHGGRVCADRAPGGGASFTVTLPSA